MRIIDTFPFNKDFITLEIRLNELWDIVDKFIIVESKYSHTGEVKPLYLKESIHFLDKYREKIILISNIKNFKTKNPRVREAYQRKLIDLEIKKLVLKPNDLIIHSDCDEIPKANAIKEIEFNSKSGNFLLELNGYSYYLNTYTGKWARCTVTSYDKFRGVLFARQNIFISQAIHQQRIKMPLIRVPDYWITNLGILRFFPIIKYNPNLILIQNAGWHFNNLLLVNDLMTKLKFSSHSEFMRNEKKYLDINYIQNMRNESRDYQTGNKLKKVEIDDSFPLYVIDNIRKYQDFIVK
jgi:beta-1,4-mannosyl-glycoprotein beta-1,4-N-acetylglucosaminyltransferase